MRMNRCSKLFRKAPLYAGLAAATLQAPVAMSQTAALEEIIITATKRLETIQDVPISVTAFSENRLKDMSLRSVGDTLDFTPNVSRSSGPSSSTDGFFFFRGVGQVDNSINVDPGVAVYMDQVYLGRLQGASFDLLDVQRIEILRGPQGTFFGRNTVGGAVNITTKEPTGTFGMEGMLVAGERDRRDGYLAVDFPIVDGLAGRASVYSRHQDGWAESQWNGATYGDDEEVGGRFKLQWYATDELTVNFTADYAESSGSQIPQVLLDWETSANGGLSPIGVPFPPDITSYEDSDPFDDDIFVDSPPLNDTDRGGASVMATWEGDDLMVRSITAYRFVDQVVNTDLDATPYTFYNTTFGTDQEQISQEFQFSGYALDDRLNWLVGLYYFEEEVEGLTDICVGTSTAIPTPFAPPPPFNPMAPPASPPFDYVPGPAVLGDGRCVLSHNIIDLEVESYATFGQVDYEVTDRLTATLGFRYTEEEKVQTFTEATTDNTDRVMSVLYGILPPFVFPAPGDTALAVPRSTFDETWEEFSPKIGLDYEWTPQFTTYISWSNGFKSGGFSGRPTPSNTLESYDPETIETWELGIKSDWFDDRLRINAAIFHSDYEEVQLLIDEIVNGTPQFNTKNGGENQIRGLELELFARPIPALQLTAGLGYLDTEWKKLNPGARVREGDPLPNTPDWTLNFGAEYMWNMGDAGSVALRGDYAYTGDQSMQAVGYEGNLQKGYALVNTRLSWISADETYTVALYGTNIFDEEYFMALNDQRAQLGSWTGVPAPGPEWGVEARFRWY